MNDIQSYLQNNYRRSDRLMLMVLSGLLVVSFALSGQHDTLKWVFLIGLPCVLLPTALTVYLPGSRWSRYAVAAAAMVMAALQIHQAAGVPELHFGIFVLLAFLLCYRDWSVVIVAAAVIAVHHLTFNYLQQWGYGVICFTHPSFNMVLVHAGYVVAESAVLCYLSILLHREAVQAAELRICVDALSSSGDGVIDLTATNSSASSESALALRKALKRIHQAVADVRQSVATIDTASEDIASGNSVISQQTQQQANALQITTSTIAELTETIHKNAQQAKQADKMASASADVAVRGGHVVGEVVATMESISTSAKRIADITSVVDSIAFQTNILALNAAVEAARAGEQGRGFAVVAAEVRNLAQRSATAAKDIKALITDSVAKVDTGSKLVTQAGDTMRDIVLSIEQVNALMHGILKVGETQSEGIERVNRALGEMHEVTTNNAALVTRAAEASHSLKNQTDGLIKIVSVFRLTTHPLASH